MLPFKPSTTGHFLLQTYCEYVLHIDMATQGASEIQAAEGGQLKAIPLARKDSVGPLVSRQLKYK